VDGVRAARALLRLPRVENRTSRELDSEGRRSSYVAAAVHHRKRCRCRVHRNWPDKIETIRKHIAQAREIIAND
jgi:hypothetical protein